MISTVRCQLCLEVNYIEAGALALHLSLTHQVELDLPDDHDHHTPAAESISYRDDLVCSCGRAWVNCALQACRRAAPPDEGNGG